MKVTKQGTGFFSAIAMATGTWIAFLLWGLVSIEQLSGLDGLPISWRYSLRTLPAYLMPKHWWSSGHEPILAGLALLGFCLGPILFVLGWIWGVGLFKQQVRVWVIVVSSLFLGSFVPIVILFELGSRSLIIVFLAIGLGVIIVWASQYRKNLEHE